MLLLQHRQHSYSLSFMGSLKAMDKTNYVYSQTTMLPTWRQVSSSSLLIFFLNKFEENITLLVSFKYFWREGDWICNPVPPHLNTAVIHTIFSVRNALYPSDTRLDCRPDYWLQGLHNFPIYRSKPAPPISSQAISHHSMVQELCTPGCTVK